MPPGFCQVLRQLVDGHGSGNTALLSQQQIDRTIDEIARILRTESQRLEVKRQYDKAACDQDLLNRGVYGTTVRDGDHSRIDSAINEGLSELRAEAKYLTDMLILQKTKLANS